VLKFFYTWKETMKIAAIPMLIVLVISSIFAANKINLEFFSITGMILVFGLGLDYVIYMIENDKRHDESGNSRLEPFAILLSFLTTAVSFGALALSSFVPVHMLGLSIFLGLTTAFLCTIL
jgi:predicted exporter